MKATLTLSLDAEIIQRLKQEFNYSELVNKQLIAYYEGFSSENRKQLEQNKREIKQKIKDLNKKKREIDKKIEKIKKKELEFLCPQCGRPLSRMGTCYKCGIRIERRGNYNGT